MLKSLEAPFPSLNGSVELEFGSRPLLIGGEMFSTVYSNFEAVDGNQQPNKVGFKMVRKASPQRGPVSRCLQFCTSFLSCREEIPCFGLIPPFASALSLSV